VVPPRIFLSDVRGARDLPQDSPDNILVAIGVLGAACPAIFPMIHTTTDVRLLVCGTCGTRKVVDSVATLVARPRAGATLQQVVDLARNAARNVTQETFGCSNCASRPPLVSTTTFSRGTPPLLIVETSDKRPVRTTPHWVHVEDMRYVLFAVIRHVGNDDVRTGHFLAVIRLNGGIAIEPGVSHTGGVSIDPEDRLFRDDCDAAAYILLREDKIATLPLATAMHMVRGADGPAIQEETLVLVQDGPLDDSPIIVLTGHGRQDGLPCCYRWPPCYGAISIDEPPVKPADHDLPERPPPPRYRSPPRYHALHHVVPARLLRSLALAPHVQQPMRNHLTTRDLRAKKQSPGFSP
jgi:hypothetical protein